MTDLCKVLDYKNGTQISKCLSKADRDDLKELKPYKELSDEEMISVLQAILPHLSTKGNPSKQSIAILKLDDLGVSVGDVEDVPVVEPVSTDNDKEVLKKVKEKKIGGTKTTETVKAEKELKEVKKKLADLEKKYDECFGEMSAIRKLLQIDVELNKK